MSGYCSVAPDHPVHHAYHDDEYGFPTSDDVALFESLSLEIMQAGLSWESFGRPEKAKGGTRMTRSAFDFCPSHFRAKCSVGRRSSLNLGRFGEPKSYPLVNNSKVAILKVVVITFLRQMPYLCNLRKGGYP